jgi:hypothetical protein
MPLGLPLLVRYKLEILSGESVQVANHGFAILSCYFSAKTLNTSTSTNTIDTKQTQAERRGCNFYIAHAYLHASQPGTCSKRQCRGPYFPNELLWRRKRKIGSVSLSGVAIDELSADQDPVRLWLANCNGCLSPQATMHSYGPITER